MSDTVDIYDDRGKLLESNVDIMSLAPTRNAAIKKIILDTKRSVAVSLAGIQGALANGKIAANVLADDVRAKLAWHKDRVDALLAQRGL